MRDVVWTRAAEADLQEVYDDLEAFRDGSGEGLLSLIGASVELLRQFPEMAPIFEAPLRRMLLNDGKHGLFYVIEDRGIILHALVDLRRNPVFQVTPRLGMPGGKLPQRRAFDDSHGYKLCPSARSTKKPQPPHNRI